MVSAIAVLASGRAPDADAQAVLRELGYETIHVDTIDAIKDLADSVALCLVDLRENGEALRIARAVRSEHPDAIVIGVADPARPHAAAEAIRAGVFDVLPRPPSARDLQALIANAREQSTIAAAARAHRHAESSGYGVVGTSPAMRPVMELVQRAAAAQCGIRRTRIGARNDRPCHSRAQRPAQWAVRQGRLLEPGPRGCRAPPLRCAGQARWQRAGTPQSRACSPQQLIV